MPRLGWRRREGARALAERIRQRVEGAPTDTGGRQISGTVSIGVACAGGRDIQDAGWLVAQADKALYAAKAQGATGW